MTIQTWIPTLLSAGSMVIGVAVMLTRKDSSLHEKIQVSATRDEEKFRSVFSSLDKIEKYLSNHIAHADERLDSICSCVNNIDKTLFAHLQNHDPK